MTKAKIRAGGAEPCLEASEKQESLKELLSDLIQQHGAPGPEAVRWAKRELARRQT